VFSTFVYDAGSPATREDGVMGGTRVAAIHVAKGRRLPMRAVEEAEVEAGRGIVGDRYHGTRHRHVSVQAAAALAEAAEVFGRDVPWELTRRNLTVEGLDAVPTAPGTRLRVGGALLEVVRVAAPCKLLDDTLGAGAQTALRRRGGSVLRALESGTVRVGDAVEVVQGGDR
jgi:MOSC domain-containing protein YiiM